MIPVLPLPRLAFGAGALSSVTAELSLLGVQRPLLLSDRGLERVGATAQAARMLPHRGRRSLWTFRKTQPWLAPTLHLQLTGNQAATGSSLWVVVPCSTPQSSWPR